MNFFASTDEMVFESEVMSQLMKMVKRVAPSNASVLIEGQSGSGKELIASRIHRYSKRGDKPFVSLNCAALRDTLLESELFGHERGAFTGAYGRKIGLAEVANGGTLFLDEIGELSPGIQSKILRFLQEGTFYRVGGKEEIKVDIRIVSATNRSLDREVVRGNFREDLYYRLNTIMLRVPSLKERKEDIIPLMKHFLPKSTFQPAVFHAFKLYSWPGNVRELKNACERMCVMSEDVTIKEIDIPESISNNSGPTLDFELEYDPQLTIYDLEKRYILKALHYYEGNKTQAANSLGITIKTLYNKLHEYGEFEKFIGGSSK